jgi:hypothetical protein
MLDGPLHDHREFTASRIKKVFWRWNGAEGIKKGVLPHPRRSDCSLHEGYSSSFIDLCLGFFLFKQALSLRTNAQSLGL